MSLEFEHLTLLNGLSCLAITYDRSNADKGQAGINRQQGENISQANSRIEAWKINSTCNNEIATNKLREC